jgi:hypothetical protein
MKPARWNDMLNTVKDFVHDVGSNSGRIARRASRSTARAARDIGPMRGLLGLAIAGAAITGGVLLVRYLRARRTEEPTERKRGMDRKRNPMHAHAH